MNTEIKCVTIKNKKIYIFNSHHYALFPWAEFRSKEIESPILLTLDHHTDTNKPFIRYCHTFDTYDEIKANELIKTIDYNIPESIENIISLLRNDEHIKTALSTDIISKALIISHSNTNDFPISKQQQKIIDDYIKIYIAELFEDTETLLKYDFKRPYDYPESDIYIPDVNENRIDLKDLYDIAIESNFLEKQFDVFKEMNQNIISDNNIFNKKYILDIDLDYFHTIKSMNPNNSEFFYKLIRNSEIITIALEPYYVNKEKYEENIDSEFLCERLIDHIKNALNN